MDDVSVISHGMLLNNRNNNPNMADPKAIFDDDYCETPTQERGLLDAQPACLKCGQIQRMMKCCTRCNSAFYCSQTCFAKHWPVHKKSCHPNNRNQSSVQIQSGDSTQENKTLYRVIQHQKPAVLWSLIFRYKAVDTLAANSDTKPHQSKDTSPKTEDCQNSDADLPGHEIALRYNKQKHRFKICDSWDAPAIITKIADFLVCLPDNMRIIHKGKQLSVDTVRTVVSPGAVFQVLGEPMEDATGLVPKDIEVLMEQMGVERNIAVRALRQSQGDLIDAMMTIGNK